MPADQGRRRNRSRCADGAVGVSDMENSHRSISPRNVHSKGRPPRFRHMGIKPGGVRPLHDPLRCPALIMVGVRRDLRNSSKGALPIFHKAGEISRVLGTKLVEDEQGYRDAAISDIVTDATGNDGEDDVTLRSAIPPFPHTRDK